MSRPADPIFFVPESAPQDGMDAAVSITVASGLSTRRSFHDLRQQKSATPVRVGESKDALLRRTSSTGRGMIATVPSRQLAQISAKCRRASVLSSWEVFKQPSPDSSGSDESAVQRVNMESKTSHKLQLPSFETLGIASPHPDYFSVKPHVPEPFCPSPSSYNKEQESAGLGLGERRDSTSKEFLLPNQTSVHILTPPDDNGTIDFDTSAYPLFDSPNPTSYTSTQAMVSQQGLGRVTATNPSGSEDAQPSDQGGGRSNLTRSSAVSGMPVSHFEEDEAIDQPLIEEAITITGQRPCLEPHLQAER